jgi:hypothetical protein
MSAADRHGLPLATAALIGELRALDARGHPMAGRVARRPSPRDLPGLARAEAGLARSGDGR